MSVASIGSSSNILASALQATGLSTDKIQIVEADVQKLQQASTGKSVDAAGARKALDTQIASDVASGKLSEDDAAKIRKALDKMEGQSTQTEETAQSGGAKAAGGKGGGGGGGGSAEKTELSRTETISSGVKTTVITYTDGTTETDTSFVSDPDSTTDVADDQTQDPLKAAADIAKSGTDPVSDFLATIEPGTLVDTYA